jgi:hypothetical protein
MKKFEVNLEVSIECNIPGIEAETPEEAEEHVREAFEDGAGWVTEYLMNTHWEIEDVSVWNRQGEDV